MAKLVKPKNRIKAKVGTGGFDEEKIEKAQNVIKENKVDFSPIAEKFLDELDDVLGNDDLQDKERFSMMLDPLMQLKAQGTMFNYSSITVTTFVVVEFLDEKQKVDHTIKEIIKAYSQTIRTLLKLELRDSEDKTCQLLVNELSKVCERYSKKEQSEG